MKVGRLAWQGCIAALVLLAAYGWYQRGDPPAAPQAAAPGAAPVPAAKAMETAPPQPSASAAAASVATAAAAGAASQPQPAASAPPLPRAEERIEVCGHGRLLQEDFERLYPQQVMWETQQRLIDALFRGTPRQQALAWLLGISLAQDRAVTGSSPPCDIDPACYQRAWQSIAPQVAAAATALVDMAVNSADPWLYQLAVSYGCSYTAAGAVALGTACPRLTSEGWQQRAPNDAAPWLWQASLARTRNDAAAVRTALVAASRQPVLTSPAMQIALPMQDLPAWRELAPIPRLTILVNLIGRSAALPVDFTVATAFCKTPLPADPDQAAICDGLIRLFNSDGATLVHQSIATRMARWRNWPSQQLQPMEALSDAAEAYYRSIGTGQQELLSCASIEASSKTAFETAALGELGALRKRVADGGQSMQEYGRLPREARRLRALAASSAAGR